MHRSTLFLLACCGVLSGIAVDSFLHIAPSVLWVCVSLSALLLLLRVPRATAAGVAILFAVGGIWRSEQMFTRPAPLWDLAASKAEVRLIGYVDGDFELTQRGGRFTFHVTRIESGGAHIDSDERVLANGPDWIQPRQGQWLILVGGVQLPNNFADFDYRSYLAKDDIHAVMYFPQYEVPLSTDVRWWHRAWVWSAGRLAGFRLALSSSIARAVPQPESGYLAGILVGAKGNVDAQTKDEFARTGTSHILAISGYNITIIASVLMLLLAPLGRRRSYWLAVVGITIFTVMVGAGASVVRAAIMGVMALTAQRVGRKNTAGTAMVATAAVMCWFNPFLLRWDVGFQLSFLAFAGIVYIEPLLKPVIERMIRIKSLASLAATTLAAQILVLPLLLFDFGQLAVYTLPVNIVVLPFVPLAMALGFATGGVGLVWPFAGSLVGQMAWLIAAVQLAIIRGVAALPYATLQVHISASALFASYVALVAGLVSLYRGRVKPITTPHV